MILHARTLVSIVIKDEELRHAIPFLIEGTPDFQLVAEYPDMEGSQRKILNKQPDILIIDADALSSFEQLSYFRDRNMKSQILIISDITHRDIVLQLLSFGVSGYILKSTCMRDIIPSLQAIRDHGAVLSPVVAHQVLESFRRAKFSPLSYRESQVLKLMTLGCPYSLIAEKLTISKETVKTHIRNIYDKLKVKCRAEVVQKAFAERLV